MQLTATRGSYYPGQTGFTVPEILIATGLGLMLLAGAASFNRFQLFALRNQAMQIEVQTAARSVVDLLAREVRRAGMDPTCGKAFEALAKARDDEIRIQSDLNGSGVIDGPNENITFRYNSETQAVERVANGVTDSLLSGMDLDGSAILYYDGAGNRLVPAVSTGGLDAARRAMVRRVRFELAVAGDGLDPNSSQSLRSLVATDVNLRNRYFLASTACP